MKNSDAAKVAWIRKTYCQKVEPFAGDTLTLQDVNMVLVELWNTALTQCQTWLGLPKENPERRSITPISLNFWLTGTRNSTPAFGGVAVVLEREMLRRMAGGFSSYFALLKKKDKRARPPAVKDSQNSFIPLTWVEKSFRVEGGELSGSLGDGRRVTFKLGDYLLRTISELPEGSRIAQVTISKREGEFWANVVCNIPRPKAVSHKGIIAIDLGAGDIVFSCSNGREFSFSARRPDKKWREEIFSVEARLEKCKKHSRTWERRMKARRKMHKLSQYQHTDHQRKLALWVVKQGMTVVVGKMRTRLGLARSSGTPDQHWGVQNTGYAFRLLIFLKEKASEWGVAVLEFPDPHRRGNVNNPQTKFAASRELLRQGCEKLTTPFPSSFQQKSFSFPQ